MKLPFILNFVKAFQFQHGIIAAFSNCTWVIYEICGGKFYQNCETEILSFWVDLERILKCLIVQ